jgi:hypothetical protein
MFGIPIPILTQYGLLGVVFLLVMFGVLVPRYFYKEKVKEAERWRQAYELSEAARAASDGQTTELLETVQTNHAFVVALFDTIQRALQSGGTRVVPSGK